LGGLKAIDQLSTGLLGNGKPDLELARVHGWLSGDGRVEERQEKKEGNTHYEVRFFPDHLTIAELFRANFAKRFGKLPHLHDTRNTQGCYTVRLRDVKICRFILSLGPFGHFGWHMPRYEFDEEKSEWVRCFFDDEAHVNVSGACIQVKSVNERGLRQVCEALNELWVDAKIYGPSEQDNPRWSPYFMLVIPKAAMASHYRLVGFNHHDKMEKLGGLLARN
jgi:hypothetical protein